MEKEELYEFIKNSINNSRIIDLLLLPSIGFKLTKAENQVFNLSKIGGIPYLFNQELPKINGNFLTFLGQISLDQIKDINDVLPQKGILYFFIVNDDLEYRYPDKKGEFRVIFIENNNEDILQQTLTNEYPAPKLSESLIEFYENYSFPSYQENIIEKNNITNDELEAIMDTQTEILSALEIDSDVEHQLLGHPNAIQGSVRFWWSMAYLGIEFKEQLTSEEMNRIRAEEDNFILLLQINFGDPRIDIDTFGDSIAYFGIHKDDLENRDFEKAVFVMQNA